MKSFKRDCRMRKIIGCRMQETPLRPSGKVGSMDNYAVQITETALRDMEELYQYISRKLKSPTNAMRQYNRIADGILTLEMFPKRYRVVDFEPERSAGLRRMTVDHYSVFYVIRGGCVVVTAVLYSASDIERRLRERE